MQYPSTSYTGQIVLSQPSSETDSQVSLINLSALINSLLSVSISSNSPSLLFMYLTASSLVSHANMLNRGVLLFKETLI